MDSPAARPGGPRLHVCVRQPLLHSPARSPLSFYKRPGEIESEAPSCIFYKLHLSVRSDVGDISPSPHGPRGYSAARLHACIMHVRIDGTWVLQGGGGRGGGETVQTLFF